MRVVLGKPGRVSKYTTLMTGGVPGDVGLPDGPNPPVEVGATYKGESSGPARWRGRPEWEAEAAEQHLHQGTG